ncbi:hypothetical protein CsatA_006547 [Cannabis sativa]
MFDRHVEDSWLWLPEPSGKFPIKSAYKTIKNLKTNAGANEKWRSIWGARIHSRLKMLWWKIVSNSLLTRGKLLTFFDIRDPGCPFCSMTIENSFHMFWECHFARAVWFGCSWQVQTSEINIEDWDNWLMWFKAGNRRPKDLSFHAFLGGAAIIFEKVWKKRNSIIHQRKSTPIKVIISQVNSRLLENSKDHSHPDSTMLKWLPPPEGWSLCNTDVAIGQNRGAGAAIFRNENGVITSMSSSKATQRVQSTQSAAKGQISQASIITFRTS